MNIQLSYVILFFLSLNILTPTLYYKHKNYGPLRSAETVPYRQHYIERLLHIMESALDVLSRAATMVQDNANETRLTPKELPTTAWRRDRRLRTGEYHVPHHHTSPGSSANSIRAFSPSSSPPQNAHVQYSPVSSSSISNTNINMRSNAHHISIMMAAAADMHPLSEATNHPFSPSPPAHNNLSGQIPLGQLPQTQSLQNINSFQNDDTPLDMSVGNLKQRNSPPPPYREPLPGSQFASSLARPSVITQAPPKRDIRDPILVTSREKHNRSCESIDEHFRRSLGKDYFSLFSKRSPGSQSMKTPSPQPHNPQPPIAHVRSTSPTLPLASGQSLPTQSTLTQSELMPLPTYSINLPSDNQQKNYHQVHHNQTHATSKANNVLSSPVIAAQLKIATGSNSPPLPLVVRPNILKNQHTLALQKSTSLTDTSPSTSPRSPVPTSGVKLANKTQIPIFSTAGSSTASALQLQHQTVVGSVSLSHLTTTDNSTSTSPCHTSSVVNAPVPKNSPNLSALMHIKIEPGLQNLKSNNTTPPASPTSTTNYNINFNNVGNYSSTSSPSSPNTPLRNPSANTSNANAEVVASVDDHFAKALGDTWKKLLENKEIRK